MRDNGREPNASQNDLAGGRYRRRNLHLGRSCFCARWTVPGCRRRLLPPMVLNVRGALQIALAERRELCLGSLRAQARRVPSLRVLAGGLGLRRGKALRLIQIAAGGHVVSRASSGRTCGAGVGPGLEQLHELGLRARCWRALAARMPAPADEMRVLHVMHETR